jgi:hypothetical protein
MSHFVLPATVLALACACAGHLKQVAIPTTRWLNDVIGSAHDVLSGTLGRLSGWLVREGISSPLELIKYLGLAAAIIAVSFANYHILEKSVAVIWPWGESAALFALALVAVVGTVAFLAHTTKSFLARTALWTMLGLLIFIHGTLAYFRTIEIERVKDEIFTVAPAPASQTVIGQESQPPVPSMDSSALPVGNAGAVDPAHFRLLLPLLAAAAAVLFSLSEAVGISRITSGPGGTALAWIVFGPLLAANWLICSAFGLLRYSNAASYLGEAIIAILDLMQAVTEKLLRLSKSFFALLDYLRQRVRHLFSFMGSAARYARLSRKRTLQVRGSIEDIRGQAAHKVEEELAIRTVEKIHLALSASRTDPREEQNVATQAEALLDEFGRNIAEIRRQTFMNGTGDEHDKNNAAIH